MSELTLWNPDKESDKAGWDLAAEKLGLGRTCPVQDRTCPAWVTGTRIRSQISLVKLS
jgi:hypothetical protein